MAERNSLKDTQNALKSYLASCKANGLADGSIGNYERVVGLYIRYMKSSGHDMATAGSVNDWKVSLAESGLKITTISNYMTILRQFFDWAVKMEMVDKSPVIPTVMPSRKAVNAEQRKPYKHILTTKDFKRILHGGRPKGVSEKNWIRNRAIIVLFLTSAIRNTELRNLTLRDIDFENGTITVVCGKGQKHRIVAFPRIAREAVLEYLSCGYRPINISEEDYLFGILSADGNWQQMERNSLSQLVERNIRILIGEDGFKTHSLRHAAASQYFDRGLDTDSISNLLGHSSVQTSQIYIERLRPSMPSQKANELFEDYSSVHAI